MRVRRWLGEGVEERTLWTKGIGRVRRWQQRSRAIAGPPAAAAAAAASGQTARAAPRLQ